MTPSQNYKYIVDQLSKVNRFMKNCMLKIGIKNQTLAMRD